MSARIRNPFTPSFGQIPLYMAGRDLVIDEIMRAFENGVGDPNLSTILIGARGSGKTALMSLLAHEAQGFGWLSVNVSALPGMLEDIAQQAKAVASSIVSVSSHAKIKSVGVPQILDIEWERDGEKSLCCWRDCPARCLRYFRIDRFLFSDAHVNIISAA